MLANDATLKKSKIKIIVLDTIPYKNVFIIINLKKFLCQESIWPKMFIGIKKMGIMHNLA
jgi:hypothetical protein